MTGGLGSLKGEVVVPGDSRYDEARQMGNRRIQRFPRAIVYCEDKGDISRCIEWARRRGAPIRLRCGGYAGEGFSTGNGALVIDLSRMNSVTVENDTIRAEGGATNRAVYDAVGPLGYAFSGGVCPATGVAGLMLGGGWGLSCRMLGLMCDSLVSAELVDAYGRGMSANPHCNQELFWALRGGGGGNFGVVTGMRFRLPDMRPEAVTLVTLRWADVDADAPAQAQFWQTWQQWLEGADPRVTLQADISRTADGIFAVSCRGLFYGPPDEAVESVKPLAMLPGCESSFEEMSFYDAMQAVMDSCPPPAASKSAGRFVMQPLAGDKIRALTDSLRNAPIAAAYRLYAMGGAVRAKSCGETAFFFRNAAYIVQIAASWEQDEDEAPGIAWVDNHFPYLAGITTGSYVNFSYSGLKDAMRAYYGGNAGRLRRVKRLYDPYGVFRSPQGVRS
jgi:FAD/FMN-containing dehydrogenase